MSDQWQQLQALFRQASELEGEAQSVFLAGLPQEQREALAPLLRHDTVAGESSLDSVADEAMQMLAPTREHIGPYRVLQKIGAGGMGTVYLAQREEDFDQQVAIKLVPTVFERSELLARFRAERQILADLDHPNVARLLDGGTTEDGLPYLVMEYVLGVPISAYCLGNKLDTAARLKLFLDVCEAVQHAHQRLVIHRDIKPDNILVTDRGVVKLLDFGVAKLVEAGADATRTQMQMMTPGYASPEQILRRPLATTSDVYSLGVLLYELLADAPPYSLESATSREIEQTICESTPAPPSTLRPELQGDLDHIVMMTLRKEPERRYQSVGALAADIRRHLDGYPVQAMPDSLRYRSEKFLRRNALPLAASFATVMVLAIAAAFVISSMDQAKTATLLARQKAISTGQAAEFLATVLSQASPFQGEGNEPSMRELLESSARDVEFAFTGEPALQTMLYAEIARTMAHIEQAGSARKVMQLALERLALARQDEAVYRPALVDSLIKLSGVFSFTGDYAAGQRLLDEAAALIPEQSDQRLLLQARLGLERARLEFAEDTSDGGLATIERVLALENLETEQPLLYAEALSQKGKTLANYTPDLEVGLELMRRALKLKESLVGELHPSMLVELDNYVSYLLDDDIEIEQIEAIAKQQEAILELHFGDDSIWWVYPVWTRGWIHMQREEWALAEQYFDRFLFLVLENDSVGMPVVWGAQDVGLAAFEQGKYVKAEQHFRIMLEYAVAAFGEQHWGISDAYFYLSAVAAAEGNSALAQEQFSHGLIQSQGSLGLDYFQEDMFGFITQDARYTGMLEQHNSKFAQ